MKGRILVLPIAAALIAGVSLWRIEWQKTHRQRPPIELPADVRTVEALKFTLNDQTGRATKLDAYLGRTRLVLLFPGEGRNLERSASLATLADIQPALAATGIQALVVTPALSSEVRSAQSRRGSPFPFPVLTDIILQDPTPLPAHRLWGRFDEDRGVPLAGLFLIGRAGETAFANGRPRPVSDIQAVFRQLAAKEWPGP
ncbi:MAG: hypothetical protein KF774_09415 [Planctomyces sp.]|nr:hypothetical protein [Planctomyces sp.]